MKRNVIWIIISITVVILIFLIVFALLKNIGFFDFTGENANVKIIATTIVLVSGIIGSLVTIIGIVLKNSIDQRNTNLKVEAENRLKLEAGMQAISMLNTSAGTTVSLAQNAGVLFTLAYLKFSELAITMLGQMLPNGKIDANTAAWLINHVFELSLKDSSLENLSIEASGLLNENYDKFLVAKDHYEFPRCLNLEWNTKLPILARRNSAMALLRMVVKRPYKNWRNDSLNAIIATLIFIWKYETDSEISGGVGKCLKIMIIIRANRIILIPGGEIRVNDVRCEIKNKKFETTSEFEKISKLLQKWVDKIKLNK